MRVQTKDFYSFVQLESFLRFVCKERCRQGLAHRNDALIGETARIVCRMFQLKIVNFHIEAAKSKYHKVPEIYPQAYKLLKRPLF